MNPNQIFEDFDRKYQSSYVQVMFKPTDTPTLFQLRRVIYDNSKFPKLELTSDTHGNVLLNYNTNARIIFKVPNNTYIQDGKSAYYFSRRPERQWKRGLNSNNAGFWCPFRGPFNRNVDPFSFKNIREAFNPTFFTLKDALDLLNNKQYNSVALSRNIAIGRSNTNNYTIYYRYAPIGTVTKDGVISAPNFDNEVRNEIK
jgi:hypothetical protein